MKRNFWILLATPLVMVACGGEDEGDQVEVATTDTATVSAPAAETPTHEAMGTSVQLASANNSGASGQATLSHQGDQLQVAVQLSGLTPGAHPGHIHRGTCASPGEVVVPLQEITADSSGAGSMTTTVALSAEAMAAGQHIIAYHGEGGAPVACGEITAHQM